jgi:hypothetical protein
MPRVGFETTIRVFERAKTVHALDRAATGISRRFLGLFRMVYVSILLRLVLEFIFQFC